jgi:hypothetical protein
MTKARDNANGGFGLVLVKPSSVVNGTDNGKGTVSFSAASTVSLNGYLQALTILTEWFLLALLHQQMFY